ncbi:MAG: hypothetical protein H7174_06205 [Flavobacterium sp.]|nr:hypothetical protein [Flavobacterium sp.]
MKNIITLLMLSAVCLVNAQAFKGKGDIKVQVGGNFQSGASGIHLCADFGIGENMSYGFTGAYLLSENTSMLDFKDRVDLRARFNANIGKVLTLPDNVDVYPGLDLGMKNFGAHLGVRYFFSEGFGLYSEAGFPIAKYDKDQLINTHNQFNFNIGVSFNL